MASGVQKRLGANRAGAMDVNTACTSFLYGLSSATAMIRTGVIRNALVVGAEVVSPFMDWEDRNVAVLFGDGCGAAVLQASDREEGLLAEKLGCFAEARGMLDIRGVGARYVNLGVPNGWTRWRFDGPEIFKRAVLGMSQASLDALARRRMSVADVGLVIPHQANGRILDAVARRLGVEPARVFVNLHRYGNMSAATVPVALVEALEEGRVQPGMTLLLPAFGAGLSYCAHVIRWGARTTPRGTTDVDLPPCDRTGLEIVNDLRARRARYDGEAGANIERARPVLDGPAT